MCFYLLMFGQLLRKALTCELVRPRLQDRTSSDTPSPTWTKKFHFNFFIFSLKLAIFLT